MRKEKALQQLDQLDENLDSLVLKKAGFLAFLRTQAMCLALWSPVKSKAPAAISGDALPSNFTLREITALWKEDRLKMRLYLEALPDTLFDKSVYKHPIGGRLSISGMVSFFSAHFNRHKKQILGILEKKFATN